MKKYLLVLVLLIVSVNLTAQTEYSGKSLGWIKLGTLDVPQKPLTWDHRVYSAKQMQIS